MRRILIVDDDKYLRKQIYRASKDIILPQHIPSDLGKQKKKMSDFFSINFSLDELEKILIENALKGANWNQKKAAEKLGIHRNTLHCKIKKFRIFPEELKEMTLAHPLSDEKIRV